MNSNSDWGKQGLVTLSAVIIVVILLIWMVCPRSERFEENAYLSRPGSDGVSIDAVTGTISGGPGFESMPVESNMAPISNSIPSNYYFLSDGSPDGEFSILNTMNSPACCSLAPLGYESGRGDWPVPFALSYDKNVCDSKVKFVGSPYFGQNTFQGSSCKCITPKMMDHLYKRGGNGNTWF